jgi:hypothetical protein
MRLFILLSLFAFPLQQRSLPTRQFPAPTTLGNIMAALF